MGWGSGIRDPEKPIADPVVKKVADPEYATLGGMEANFSYRRQNA
jgi:hypothetical protein